MSAYTFFEPQACFLPIFEDKYILFFSIIKVQAREKTLNRCKKDVFCSKEHIQTHKKRFKTLQNA